MFTIEATSSTEAISPSGPSELVNRIPVDDHDHPFSFDRDRDPEWGAVVLQEFTRHPQQWEHVERSRSPCHTFIR